MMYKPYRAWYSRHIYTIASNDIEYKNCTRWIACVARDCSIWLANVSTIKHIHSVLLRENLVLFLKLTAPPLKNLLLERCSQHMIGGLKTVNLTWVNKIAVIGGTWIFVYESARSYERRLNAAPNSVSLSSVRWAVQKRWRYMHTYTLTFYIYIYRCLGRNVYFSIIAVWNNVGKIAHKWLHCKVSPRLPTVVFNHFFVQK